MKITYDTGADALYISLNENRVAESEDIAGFILDYDERKCIVGIEILNASKNVNNPDKVEFKFL